jgi:ElaB/YqjD/DUF883 family membrane-anchored ribosome-binding protein
MTTATTENKSNGATSEFKTKVIGNEYRLEKIAHDVGEKMGTVTSGLGGSASNYIKTGREFVKENPTKGIAIAAVAGVLAGSLLTLALRRRQ